MNFVSKVKIEKGWSEDQKYCVTEESGVKYLLRLSPAEQYERKRAEFELMQRFAALGIPMCRPIAFGQCAEGVYSRQGWIEGVDAESLLPTWNAEKQYEYGLEAGRILKVLHSLPAPSDAPDWATRYDVKIDRKLARYRACPLQYPDGQVLIDYILANRTLSHGRPQVYQHGDYHIGNMMIGTDEQLYIIDFNRSDYGDPWEEFNRIVWCAQKAPAFATGMVDGYFLGKDISREFWALLALYIASNTLSSLPWAIPFGEVEIQTMTSQAEEILAWYNGMTNVIPSWYQDNHH